MTTVLDLNIHDADDRLKEFNKINRLGVQENIEMLIRSDPFLGNKFYIFAHARKDDNGVDTRIIWQPRLTKPKAQTNSMLFKVDPKQPEEVIILWILPPREQWPLFEKGKLCENQTVIDSIHLFEKERGRLEAADPDDLDDKTIDKIYEQIKQAGRIRRMRKESESALNLSYAHLFKEGI